MRVRTLSKGLLSAHVMAGRYTLLRVLCLWGLLLQLTLAGPALGAASCHCFKDRSYDPSDPGRIDPFVLATTQNSFMAVAYGIPKGKIVMAKMEGTSGDDLWVAHFVAQRARLKTQSLLTEKRTALTWKNVLEQKRVPLGVLGGRFREHILRGDDVSLLAALSACETIADRLGTSWKDLETLLVLSASPGEIVTAALLERWSGKNLRTIYEKVRGGVTTWGAQLHSAGIQPGKVEDEIRKLVP